MNDKTQIHLLERLIHQDEKVLESLHSSSWIYPHYVERIRQRKQQYRELSGQDYRHMEEALK